MASEKSKRLGKIVLYNPKGLAETRSAPIVPLPLVAIAALPLSEGFEVKIISKELTPDFEEALIKECADALCFGVSSMTGYQITDGLKVSRQVKEKFPKLPVIWGGWHPSLLPLETIEEHSIDFVVRAQGERTFFELVKALARGSGDFSKIDGLTFKKKGRVFSNRDRCFEDLNGFPPFPYGLVDVEKCLYTTEFGDRTINYVSSYGCPHRCGFCAEQTVNKRRWGGFSAERVVSDMQRFKEEFGADCVFFHDSNFFVDLARVKKICELLMERNVKIKWGNVNGRTRQLARMPEEIWRLLEKSGCCSILTGAESGFEESLEFISKDCTVEDTLEFARLSRKHNMKVVFSMLVGLPWSPDSRKMQELVRKEFDTTFSLIDRLLEINRNPRMMLYLYTPYPGSPLYRKALELGFKVPNTLEGWSRVQLELINTPWVPKSMASAVEMITRYIFFMIDPDSSAWFAKRISNPFLKAGFLAGFALLKPIALLRWKLKFFGLPLDYKIYNFAREHSQIG